MKQVVCAFAVLLFLIVYAPSGSESAPARGGLPSFAIPKDLPSKGSPGAKLTILMFTEFH